LTRQKIINGVTKNAGLENAIWSKIQEWKMQE